MEYFLGVCVHVLTSSYGDVHENKRPLHFDTDGSLVNMCMHYPGHMVFNAVVSTFSHNRMQNIPQCLQRGIIAPRLSVQVLNSVSTVFLPSEVRQTIVSRIQHDVLKSDKVNI